MSNLTQYQVLLYLAPALVALAVAAVVSFFVCIEA